jgi:acetyl-CoA carboxylase beta subunit
MKAKYTGIWMDHADALLMELSNGDITTKTITSKFTHQQKEQVLAKGEKAMHHKEQHEELAYYQEIGVAIKDCTEVMLFGPTEAKTELLNILRADHHFDNIEIEIMPADKMTENQQQAFVKDYFLKHLS